MLMMVAVFSEDFNLADALRLDGRHWRVHGIRLLKKSFNLSPGCST